MLLARTLKYAGIQARLRARIGRMPNAQVWRSLAVEPGVELLDGLTGTGLDFWLEGLSPSVGTDGLERHFNGRIRFLFRQLAAWLPAEWHEFADRLTLVPDIFWVGPLLSGHDPGTLLDRDSVLHEVVRAGLGQRGNLLAKAGFAGYIDDSGRPQDLWRADILARIPAACAAERRPVQRLVRIIDRHLADIGVEYEKMSAVSSGAAEAGLPSGDWRYHRELEGRARMLLAGDPFHPALILVYGLLEMMTMEKLRALLLGRLLDWPPPPALEAGASHRPSLERASARPAIPMPSAP